MGQIKVITIHLLRSPQDIDVMYELKIEQAESYFPKRGIWRSGSLGWNLRVGRVNGTEKSGTFTVLAHRGVRAAWKKVS